MEKNSEIKTVGDYEMAFQDRPHCCDCKYCSPNYAPLAPTSHICENDDVEDDFIFGEDDPCEKWEYRTGKSAPSTEDVFRSGHSEYCNLAEDDEGYDDEDD